MSIDATSAAATNALQPVHDQFVETSQSGSLMHLIAEHGQENIDNAAWNHGNRVAGEMAKANFAAQGHGEAITEQFNRTVDSNVAALERPTTPSATYDLEAIYASNWAAMMEDASEEASQGAGEGRKGKGGAAGAGNWLALMAQALGKVAGDHLAKAVELADSIGAIGGEQTLEQIAEGQGLKFNKSQNVDEDDPTITGRADEARLMTMLQAHMQAETQLFKMSFEAASTLVKTTGEGFSTMARKQ